MYSTNEVGLAPAWPWTGVDLTRWKVKREKASEIAISPKPKTAFPIQVILQLHHPCTRTTAARCPVLPGYSTPSSNPFHYHFICFRQASSAPLFFCWLARWTLQLQQYTRWNYRRRLLTFARTHTFPLLMDETHGRHGDNGSCSTRSTSSLRP